MRFSCEADSSVTSNIRNALLPDNSFTNWNSSLAGIAAAIAIPTFPSVLIYTIPVVSPSSASVSDGKNLSYRTSLEAALNELAVELQSRSKSLSSEDSILYREMIQSELKPGFPDF
jgi:hypothetical protein